MQVKFISKALSAVLSAAMLVTSLPTAALAVQADEPEAAAAQKPNLLKLWYDEPASQGKNILSSGAYQTSAEDNNWQQHTLPIGNSYMGANVYGEIARERLTFNQKTMWNGGPSSKRPNYNGGNKDGMVERYQNIVNNFLAGNDATASEQCGGLTGEGEAQGYGVYQSWGDLYLDYKDLANVTETEDYERNLDLTTGIANVDFVAANTEYHREYFVSYPDNVLAMKLTTGKDAGMNLNVSFPIDNGENESEQTSIINGQLGKENLQYTVDAAEGTILNAGNMQDNQLKFNSVLKVVTDKGAMAKGADNSSLDITGAKEVVIFLSANTDYKNVYPKYRTGETAEQLAARVKKAVDNAAGKGYERVKTRYLADYQALFGRVDLDLGQGASEKTTDDLLAAYKASGKDAATEQERRLLETLLYQYGRYLTIASSRDGDLPSNLQGVWNNRVGTGSHVPWGSDFHMNVNLQMNYWPTYSANLAECATPIIDYVNSLREPGRVTAEKYFGIASEPGEANGFSAHTQNTPFGWTCPGWAFSWGWSPGAVPWIIQNCWEYYEYTGDLEYMRTHLYPMMKEETILYDKILIDSGKEITLADGTKSTRLVTAPTYSSEHGPYTMGNTYENSLAWQLYDDTITAAKLLDVDSDLVTRWEKTRERLAPVEIGDSGQIKEWYIEGEYGKTESGENISSFERGHRHMSHMLGLFPGDLISVEDTDLLNAAVVSLEDRGYTSTGWGMGQRINAWARTGSGNTAYRLIQNLFKGGIYPNLWDAHPPFQIDGNFGYTSGVNEMLMQSNMGYINILPALPEVWANGSVNGILARGNFELGIDWTNGTADEIRILSKNGGECAVQYPGIATAVIKDSSGSVVASNVVSGKENRITFNTTKGEAYTIQSMSAAPENCKAVAAETGVTLTWDAVEGATSYNVYSKVRAIETKIGAVSSASYTDTKKYEDVYAVEYSVAAVKDGKEGRRSNRFRAPEPESLIELVDDGDARIKYSDGWGTWSDSGHYGGGIHFIETTTGEESVELSFEGTGIEIIARKNSGRYAASWKVLIDGADAGTANCAGSGEYRNAVFSNYDLPDGKHTIKLVTEGNTNKKIEFDAFFVYKEKDPDITVSFSLGGKEGEAPASKKGKFRGSVTLPVCNVDGFTGWSDGSGVYNAGAAYVVPYKDIKLTAQYEEEETEPPVNTTDEYLPIDAPKTSWTATAGSQENSGNDGPASSAIDGNLDTWWHSNYSGVNEPSFGENGVNNDFTIDFGKTVQVDKLEYVPRNNENANGFITQYKIFYSATTDGAFTECASGEWTDCATNRTAKSAIFDSTVSARRIQIKAIAVDNAPGGNSNKKFIHAAEFNVYKKNPNCTPLIGISVDSSLTLNQGESKSLTITYQPENATDKKLTYASSDVNIATVSPKGVVMASAYKSGTATISIASANKPEITRTVTVTVNPPTEQPVTSVTLERKRILLKVEDSVTLDAAIQPYFGTNKSLTWESSDSTIATVTDGTITAVAAGKATITVKAASDNTKSDTCEVLVAAKGEEPDRTELLGLVSELQTQYSDLTGYGQDIAAAFETALAKAQEVLAYRNDVLQSELDEALDGLNTAKKGLMKEDLTKKIAEADGITENNYAQSSVDALNAAKAAAQTVANNTAATVDEIDAALFDLALALKNLEAPGDPSDLQELLTEAGGINTQGSSAEAIAEFEAAKTAAQAVVAGRPTQSEIDAALRRLERAISEVKIFTVRFDKNAGSDNVTGMPENKTGRKGEQVTLPTGSPQRTGYIFSGWSLEPDGEILTEGPTIHNTDLTVYAIWEVTCICEIETLTVEGGSVNIAADESSKTFPLSPEAALKAGCKVPNHPAGNRITYSYTVKNADGTGAEVDADGVVTVKAKGTAVITVTAQIATGADGKKSKSEDVEIEVTKSEPEEPDTVKITFEANGTSVTNLPEEETVEIGAAFPKPSKIPVRAGYTFKGWSKTASGAVITEWPQTIDSNTTFYAIWEEEVNECACEIESLTVEGGSILIPAAAQDANFRLNPVAVFKKDVCHVANHPTGNEITYSFEITDSGDTGAEVSDDGLVTASREGKVTIKVTAEIASGAEGKRIKTQTVEIEVTKLKEGYCFVKFEANGSGVTNMPENVSVEEGGTVAKPSGAPERAGYTFKGWSKTESGAVIADDEWPQTINEDTTYYAVWEKISGGELTQEEAEAAVAEAISEASETHEKGKGDYSSATWNAFVTAYQAAQNPKEGITPEELKQLADNLEKAREDLKLLDRKQIINDANGVVNRAKGTINKKNTKYTAVSWNAYKAAYDALVSEINKGAKADLEKVIQLQKAFGQKKLVTDTTWEKAKNALNLALKNAKTKYAAGQKNYTKETWDAFARAYAAANKQSNAIAGNSAAANLNNLAKALNTALGKLKESLLNASVVKDGICYVVTDETNKTAAAYGEVSKKSSLKKVVIPDTITIQGTECAVTEIKAKGFSKFKKITQVTIGKNVKKIGAQAFKGCAAVTKLTVNGEVKTFDKQCFNGCKKLKKITFKGKKAPAFKSGAFKGTNAKAVVKLAKKMSKKDKNKMKTRLKKAGISKKAKIS